jgi:hypothetical protein
MGAQYKRKRRILYQPSFNEPDCIEALVSCLKSFGLGSGVTDADTREFIGMIGGGLPLGTRHAEAPTLGGTVTDAPQGPPLRVSSGFDFRFLGQDRREALTHAGEQIRALVPRVQSLRAQPSLSPQDQFTLRTAESELQRQMNLYALASSNPDDLRRSGIVPAEGFELRLRVAEAIAKARTTLHALQAWPGSQVRRKRRSTSARYHPIKQTR